MNLKGTVHSFRMPGATCCGRWEFCASGQHQRPDPSGRGCRTGHQEVPEDQCRQDQDEQIRLPSPQRSISSVRRPTRLFRFDKYLDDAYLAHLPSVRIVHGKGTGALRNAVQAHLKRLKYVKSFHLGEFGEGDASVTIAEFKD